MECNVAYSAWRSRSKTHTLVRKISVIVRRFLLSLFFFFFIKFRVRALATTHFSWTSKSSSSSPTPGKTIYIYCVILRFRKLLTYFWTLNSDVKPQPTVSFYFHAHIMIFSRLVRSSVASAVVIFLLLSTRSCCFRIKGTNDSGVHRTGTGIPKTVPKHFKTMGRPTITVSLFENYKKKRQTPRRQLFYGLLYACSISSGVRQDLICVLFVRRHELLISLRINTVITSVHYRYRCSIDMQPPF